MLKLADRTKSMSPSVIREILKVTKQPGMISLAGGNPDPKTFPLDFIKTNINNILEKYGTSLFQYGLTEGFEPLRISVANYLKTIGINIDSKSVFISTGAQSAINAAAAVLVNKGDKIGVEAPTFLGSINTFKIYEPEFIALKTDAEGVIPEELLSTITKHKIRLIYLQPNFQNPTGHTLSNTRRLEIAELIKTYDLIAIEDDPYHELNYTGTSYKTLYELAPENVIYISSLSKIFSPGLRLGYYLGPSKIIEKMIPIKQGIDVHTDNFAQALATEYMDSQFFPQNLQFIRTLYEHKSKTMADSIANYFPTEMTVSKVLGGMFIWCRSNRVLDKKAIYTESIQKKVAYVPGETFYVKPPATFTMRLNFTNVDEQNIKLGIETLGSILKRHI